MVALLISVFGGGRRRRALGLLGAASAGLFVDVQLTSALDNVVALATDVDGWVGRGGVLLDGVAALGFDGDFALGFGFDDLAAWLAGTPRPGDCGKS